MGKLRVRAAASSEGFVVGSLTTCRERSTSARAQHLACSNACFEVHSKVQDRVVVPWRCGDCEV